MKIQTYSFSNQGGREYNEDSVRCSERDGVCAVVVADGLGGHGGGQIASSVAADCIVGAFMQDPKLEADHLRSIFEKANKEVLAAQTASQKMKSTGVALFANGGNVMWAHAGDSRLYYFKGGALTAYTLDHSVSQMAVFSGEITRDQIRHHSDRNRVLRAFGGDETIKTEVSQLCAIDEGSAFLLCTDGYWEYVLESEMEAELAKSKTPRDWVESMNKLLAARVPNNNDNFSAAAVFFGKSGGVNKKFIIAAAVIAAIAIIAAIALIAVFGKHGGDADGGLTEDTDADVSTSDSASVEDKPLPAIPSFEDPEIPDIPHVRPGISDEPLPSVSDITHTPM